ncbi:MAG: YqgE/AlgH family protein [Zetaproteobacteria bacterium]|nr:YqgE/AlgH family protein [Zetaproteobacteria bacterium]
MHTRPSSRLNQKISAPVFLTANPAKTWKDTPAAGLVILLGLHTAFKSIGWTINQPTSFTVDEILESEQINLKNFSNTFVWNGGPEETYVASILHRLQPLPAYEHSIAPQLVLCSLENSLYRVLTTQTSTNCNDFRILVGCHRWGPGNLAWEISQNYWKVHKYDPHILFEVEAESIAPQLCQSGTEVFPHCSAQLKLLV